MRWWIFHEAEGRVKYSLLRVDNHGIQWRGVCNNSFIIHLHRISGGKKIMMKKGKKWKMKKKVQLAGFELKTRVSPELVSY